MTFPSTPLDKRVELFLGDSLGWVDVTGDVYARDPIVITRGRRDAAARVDPGTCTLTLNNREGKYSPRNPLSPYYGVLGRNTPIRVSVAGPESYLDVSAGTPDSYASSPADPALVVDGTLDVRIEATGNWHSTGEHQNLIGQWRSPDQRVWVLSLTEDRYLTLEWSTTGSDSVWANWSIPPHVPERAAFRAVYTEDNGAGKSEVMLYWALSMDDAWEPIGDTLTMATLYPMWQGASEPLKVPQYASPVAGTIHRAEVITGITPATVAYPDFRWLAPGTTSFTDVAGRAWEIQGNARISNRAYRFHGEVSEWPLRWDLSGSDVWSPITGSGILRRMGQGAPTLQSSLRRLIPKGGDGQPPPLNYWPMEDGRYATRAASAIDGAPSMYTDGLEWASNDGLFGSDVLPVLSQRAAMSGFVPKSSADGWHVDMAYFLDKLPDTESRLLQIRINGSNISSFEVDVSSAGVKLSARDRDYAVVATYTVTEADALAALTGEWNRLMFFTSTAGSDIHLYAYWRDVVTGQVFYGFTNAPGSSAGHVQSISALWEDGLAGMAVGHFGVWDVGGSSDADGFNASPGITYFDDADDGFENELANNRVWRLSLEESTPVFLYSGTVDTERVGPQRVKSFLTLLEESMAADSGLLYEHRRTTSLAARFRGTMYNQAPALTLDYASGKEVAAPFEPVDDDQDVANDVEVTREFGSSGRAILEDGPLSIKFAPDGIGPVNKSVTLNLGRDDQTERVAHWLLHLGTVDEARYPNVNLMLHAAPHLAADAISVDVLDRISIVNTPPWLPPGSVDLIVDGYTETLGVYTWDLSFNCSPGSPYVVGTVGVGSDAPDSPVRADTSGSALAADVDSAETVLAVQTDAGPTWTTDPTDLPFDIRVGGEVMRVDSVGILADDLFDRTVVDGWGTSSSGHVWDVVAGDVTDFDVSSGAGTIGAPPASDNIALLGGLNLSTCEAYAELDVNVASNLWAHRVGTVMLGTALLHTSIQVIYSTSGNHLAGMYTVDGGVSTLLGSVDLPWLAAGVRVAIRTKVDSTGALYAKVWQASTAEPDEWSLAHDGIGPITGAPGVAVTDLDSAVASYYQFEITAPQAFTVQRSVNGIVKSHSAGADVRLAHPMIVAL